MVIRILFLIYLFFPMFSKGQLYITTTAETLGVNKSNVSKNKELTRAKRQLIQAADRIVNNAVLYSVADKNVVPEGGTAKDFYSLGLYWWPNPNTESGLPYIRRDGKRNPEVSLIADDQSLKDFTHDVYRLGLAYYYSEEEKYAQWAVSLVDAFILDKKTGMNPNFEYAQVIKGVDLRTSVTITGVPILKLLDGVTMIKTSPYWTLERDAAFKSWVASLNYWYHTNKWALSESRLSNNIASYYLAQTAAFYTFTDNIETAKREINNKLPAIIGKQLDREGAMVHELKRAKPWSYVVYNLQAYDYILNISTSLGLDLVEAVETGERSLEDAYLWLERLKLGGWHHSDEKVNEQVINKALSGSSQILGKPVRGLNKQSLSYLDVLIIN